MKKKLLFCILLCSVHICYGQLTSHVDERFELTSIAARLAEYDEYSHCRVQEYATDIDSYFAPYKQHPLIPFLQKVRESNHIAYDAISSVAAALEIHKGVIRLQPIYTLKKQTDIEAIDRRWDKETLSCLIPLLNDFYRKSKFRYFYEQHTELYESATERMNNILKKLNVDWFERFYGISFGNPAIYLSLCNGPSNYALAHPHAGAENGILIGCSADNNGNPNFGKLIVSTIVHELNHHYANPLAFEFESEMTNAVDSIAPRVEALLSTGAYGKGAILPEWLTRLTTLMYMQNSEHDSFKVPFMITNDASVGIIWQKRAYAFMEHFNSHRHQYPYFRDFMPQLVAFLKFTADNIDQVVCEYENRSPYVVDIYPMESTDLDLSQDVIEIEITFSDPMTAAAGIELVGTNLDALENIQVPENFVPSGWVDEKTYVVRLKSEWIKIGGITGVKLNRKFFLNKDNYSLKDDYTITYNIK